MSIYFGKTEEVGIVLGQSIMYHLCMAQVCLVCVCVCVTKYLRLEMEDRH